MCLVQKPVYRLVVGYAAQFTLYGNQTPSSDRLFVANRQQKHCAQQVPEVASARGGCLPG